MVPGFRSRPVLRERSVLAVGLASAGVLVGAAFVPFGDAELAGRAALARLSAETADAVVAEWQRVLRDPRLPAESAGIVAERIGAPASFQWARPRVLDTRGAPPSEAFDALFAESERAELQGDRDKALDLVVEALEKQRDSVRKMEARLRAIQLAAASGRPDVARDQLQLARSEVTPDRARGEVSWLLLCTLAAEPALEEPIRAEALASVRAAWESGRLALPGWDADLAAGSGEETWYDVPDDPRRTALLRRLGEVLGEPGLAEQDRDLRREAAVGRLLDPWGDEDPGGSWRFIPVGEAFFAWRHDREPATWGTFVTAEGLAQRFALRVAESGLLPAGFSLDFRGDGGGEVVRGRTPLLGDALGFALRHEDPAALVRAEGRRMQLIRAALLLMSLFAAGAGVSTFLALRRERVLANLKTSFVANVSHELRTPVASILLMAENLEAGRVPDAKAERRYHGLIRREAVRLRRLVDDVLDFSRLERGRGFELRREDTALAGWLADLRHEVEDWAAGCGADVTFDLGGVHGSAAVDREALRRAVFNLLDNAAKYGAGAPIRVSARAADGWLALAVADRGPGVPARRRGEVFQPFARMAEGNGHAAGAGLGLAIVREIAEAHGGSVSLTDREGGGAVFELAVPLEDERTEVTG